MRRDSTPAVRYREAAIAHGAATESGDHKQANAVYDRLIEALEELRAIPDGLRALESMLQDQNSSVRSWAASHLLPTRSDAAIEVLEQVSREPGLVAFSAHMVLKEWRAGRSFTLIESEYDKVPALLGATVVGFRDSIEYGQLDEELKTVPGLVCAAFARYLVRCQEAEERHGELTGRDAQSLRSAFQAIEVLSRSNDDDIRTLLKDELFECLDCSVETLERIRSKLDDRARALFDEVRGR